MLARGSAFFVQGPKTQRPIALLSAHVAAPHRFPNYFPQPWLQHVQDKHCRTVIESRSSDGKVLTSTVSTFPLSTGFRHASLDVAAFLPVNDSPQPTKDTSILRLATDLTLGAEDDSVTIAGYRLIGDAGSGTEAVLPIQLQGTLADLQSSRGFVNTGAVHTEMGMCGGPVFMTDNPTVCVGILEGLIPIIPEEDRHNYKETHRRLEGHSVFVTANELIKFLHDVETEAQSPESHIPNP